MCSRHATCGSQKAVLSGVRNLVMALGTPLSAMRLFRWGRSGALRSPHLTLGDNAFPGDGHRCYLVCLSVLPTGCAREPRRGFRFHDASSSLLVPAALRRLEFVPRVSHFVIALWAPSCVPSLGGRSARGLAPAWSREGLEALCVVQTSRKGANARSMVSQQGRLPADA
jgi:hypothetical protein